MKKWLKGVGIACGLILLVFFVTVQRIDRTPLAETAHYTAWKSWIGGKTFSPVSADSTGVDFLHVGWASVNITPDHSVPMAGYGNRWGAHFERVLDSLYMRAISVSSGTQTVTFVSADLLIIPPNVTRRFHALLAEDGIAAGEVHLGATHTHHGLGGWGEKLAGRLFAGKFDLRVEEMLALKMRDAVRMSRTGLTPAAVTYQETEVEDGIRNRLRGIENPVVDPELRSLRFVRADSSEAILLVYGAHSTTLRRDSLYLSRDYPGYLIDELERDEQIDFVLFMAGAVGSMGFRSDEDIPEKRAASLGIRLAEAFRTEVKGENAQNPLLLSEWIPVPIPPQTGRINRGWALRPWVFNALFGQSAGDIKLTLIGRTLFLGMPADFSGEIMVELDRYARDRGLDLVISSFNGYYTGYITHDRHYDEDLYETTTMSWNGYAAGDYYTVVAKDLIDKIAALKL